MARKKPIPRSARKEINRGTLRSRGDDTVKNISVGFVHQIWQKYEIKSQKPIENISKDLCDFQNQAIAQAQNAFRKALSGR